MRDVNFGVIPISHSYGFSNLLTPLIVRGVSLALSTTESRVAIIDGLAASRAQPFFRECQFHQSFCEMNEPPLCRTCDSAFGGRTMPVGDEQAFREKSDAKFTRFYGASECGGICYGAKASQSQDLWVEAMCGRMCSNWSIPKSRISLIRVRSGRWLTVISPSRTKTN